MKIEVQTSNAASMSFVLDGATHAYANAVRRTAMNNVKTFAIDRVTVYENTSAMFDEYIAHRIGLVPLSTPKRFKDEDEVMFTLDATGPLTVYSKDLETKDKDISVANDKIQIMKLAEGQRLRLEGKARVGTGSKHAKFQPGLITYEENKGKFTFYVETFGQMTPKEIVGRALESIEDELKDVQKEAKKL